MLEEPLLALHLFLIFDLPPYMELCVLYFSPCLCIALICALSLLLSPTLYPPATLCTISFSLSRYLAAGSSACHS